MVASRFPNPKNPLKIRGKFFRDELFTASASSYGIMLELIKKAHKENPYESIDEIIGDMEMIVVEVLNEFQVVAGNVKSKMYKVEDYQTGRLK